MWAAQREISAYSPLKSSSSSIPRYLKCHMLHCCNCCGIIRYVKAMPKSYTKCPRVSSLPFFCMCVSVYGCECVCVGVYHRQGFQPLILAKEPQYLISIIGSALIFPVCDMAYSIFSCLMQLSEPENLGSELHDSRAQATDRQRHSHRQTYVYILLLTNYLPHFRLHFYANPVGRRFLFGFLFAYSQMYFPLAFLRHKDFEAH